MIPELPKNHRAPDLRRQNRFFPFRQPPSRSPSEGTLRVNSTSEGFYYQGSFVDHADSEGAGALDPNSVEHQGLPDQTGGVIEADGATERPMYLDSVPRIDCSVGYGEIGLNGALGYEGKYVSVGGRIDSHAISTHGPAKATFRLNGQFDRFECFVALNDDVPPKISSADFTVAADGQLLGSALGVRAGDAPRPLTAELNCAQVLELAVRTGFQDFCHAVWLDAKLFAGNQIFMPTSLPDCLGRTQIRLPAARPRGTKCVATVASDGFASLLDDMLGSLIANGCCQDALFVVFCPEGSHEVARIAAKYDALLIHFAPVGRVGTSLKSALYSVARVVDAQQYLCLDADMLVLGDLRPIFAAIEACPEGAILVCREENDRTFEHLLDGFLRIYRGDPNEISMLFDERVAMYPLVVNDGLFAAGRSALVALDSALRSMSKLRAWMDTVPGFTLRNQFLFNAALATSNCGIELDPSYNLQLQRAVVRPFVENGRLQAEWNQKRVAVVHFNGDGRHKHLEFKRLLSATHQEMDR